MSGERADFVVMAMLLSRRWGCCADFVEGVVNSSAPLMSVIFEKLSRMSSMLALGRMAPLPSTMAARP